MDVNNDHKKMEAELREAVSKAFSQLLRSLEQEPSVIIEFYADSEVPDAVIEEIEAWLFKRRQNNGDKHN